MYTFDSKIVSDLHKDARGMRPSTTWFHMWNSVPDDVKQNIWDQLLIELADSMESEAQQEIAAINAFEVEIATALDLGARSRSDAVRWIVQSMDLDDTDLMYGGSAICYRKGLPYRMAAIFDNAINLLNYEAA